MFMRLCLSTSLCVAAAAALVPVSPAAAHAAASPSCAAPGDRAFPLTTRIHGGPGSYEAGGDFGTWYLDLTNTTGRTCADIHPVVVLTDRERRLKPSQPRLEFYDGGRALPVTFESTDEQELVGVMDAAGFKGFTVAPGRTVTVKVRLSLASDAVPDQVTANAAVIQRRGADGDWVGQSNDYRFGIDEDTEGPGQGEDEDGTREEGGGDEGGRDGSAEPSPAAPSGTARATPSGTAVPGTSLPVAVEAEEAGERARELARTGPGLAHGLLAAVTALLAVTGGAFLLARRRR
ncbi:hypothetical protein ACF08B_21325 [Streptomyces sp. NPDC015139]|uniref:hypothetical protein n=1 Tax=Streptomyces sp. NPDC015139 TaxID=3364942 RepID=UPI0036FB6065